MSVLRPRVPTPPPAPPPPPVADPVDMERATALSEEATAKSRRKRGSGSTIVAGALGDTGATTGTPTLLG